jgi:uncharacterized membrane protein YkvA (DUF1232 family)
VKDVEFARMSEKAKNSDQPQRSIGFLRSFWQQIRLSWALLLDNRVPLKLKVIPLTAIAYVLSPIDLVPDVIPVLGQLDDLGVLMAALTTFNNLAPADVTAEHMERLHTKKKYRIRRNADGTVIDVEAERIDD